MSITGANTSELFHLEKRLHAMIERLDGVISQGPGFLSRLINNWLGPLADLFGTTWQHTDLPSINHVRDSLQENQRHPHQESHRTRTSIGRPQ